MKKILPLILIYLLNFSLGIAQNNKLNIKIKLKGIEVGEKCFLGNYFADKQYLQDSAVVDAKGFIEFKKNELLPGGIYFVILPDKKYFELILDKNQVFSLETDTAHLIKNMKIKGSTDNQLFYDYMNFIDNKFTFIKPLSETLKELEENDEVNNKEKIEKLRNEIKIYNKEIEDYKYKFIEKNPEVLLSKIFLMSKEIDIPDAPLNEDGSIDSTFPYKYYKENYFQNFDFRDDRILRTPVFFNRFNNYVNNLVIQMPDSIIAEAVRFISQVDERSEMFKYLVWYFTNYTERSKIMGMESAFVKMVELYYMTNKAYWVSAEVLEKITERAKKLKPILINAVAPNITVLDSIGRKVSLHNINADYIIFYIWSTDCGHCKKSTPLIKDFYLKNKEKMNLEVFALCTETDIDEWKKVMLENNANWINTWDPINMSNFRDIYDVYSTPIIFILDKDKKIIAKRIDAMFLDEFFERYEKSIKHAAH